MDVVALAVGAAAGVALGSAFWLIAGRFARSRRWRRGRDRSAARVCAVDDRSPADRHAGQLDLVRRGVDAMSAGLVVLDATGQVVLANPAARHLGVVNGDGAAHPVLRTLGQQAHRVGDLQDTELDLPRGGGREPLGVRVRVVPLGTTGHTAVQVTDVTEAHRVSKVRRDFVANVGHELKTPVGALSLLAEALLDATDDPEAVRRFAERVRHESVRLGRLVHELIELSRLQGADPLPQARPVPVDRLVAEVVDRSRLAAEAKRIALVVDGDRGLVVAGCESQLVTALCNLVDNAVAYSPADTRVTIAPRRGAGLVEVSVADQGIGIGESDRDRIFERFYRADPARSRVTGGTGLGLAIVKHIATNHGGSVDVHSTRGRGSTFTLRLPPASRPTDRGEA